MRIGYARVSSNNQDLELQKHELLRAGCKKIFGESVSGKDNNRTELMAMFSSLREGDIVIWFIKLIELRDLLKGLSKS